MKRNLLTLAMLARPPRPRRLRRLSVRSAQAAPARPPRPAGAQVGRRGPLHGGQQGRRGAGQGRDIDVQKEFDRYLVKVLRRETELKVIEPGPVDYPVYDLAQLAKQPDFWRALGERTQADMILAGGLDFDIQDRSGYRTEEYVSPFNGRTYYRQVLVEQTGFQYDILMQVYDGKTGELFYQDNFKDFQNFEGENTDPLAGMFENLLSLEDRISTCSPRKKSRPRASSSPSREQRRSR